MDKNKILIIENDVLVRQSIANRLQESGGFRVTGMTLKDKDPDDMILSLKPGVALLNIESLESEGFDIFTRLRRGFPELPIVVISPRTTEGGKAAIKALQMGAVDFITKPRKGVSLLFARRHLSKRVVPIVRAAAQVNDNIDLFSLESIAGGRPSHSQQEFEQMSPEARQEPVTRSARLLVVGGCTGGPKALFSLIAELPVELDIPVVIVQHLPGRYTKLFAEALSEHSRLEVKEAFDGAELTPGTIWVASGGYHSEVHNEDFKMKLRMHRGPREMGDRPSINVLFRSAAQHYGPETLGVILSGHGSDGVGGAKAITMAGGSVLGQKPRSSLAPDMPLRVLRSGITDQSYPISELTGQIAKRISGAGKPFGGQSYKKSRYPRPLQVRMNGV
ncbi:MAG TPA: chemotaxis protein CheB [Fodinibius sp.]|nr:chemotaxis protein CheB [Fodinibius sp.]